MLNVETVLKAFGPVISDCQWTKMTIMEIQNQITDLGFISGIFEFYVYFSEVGFWILCL